MRAVPILFSAMTLGLAGGYIWSAMAPATAAPISPATAAPATPPQPVRSTEEIEHSVYYAHCADARAAGAAPIYEGQPGYREGLDGDGDRIACEPYNGSGG